MGHLTLLCRVSATQSVRPVPAALTEAEVMANLRAVSLVATRWRAFVRVPDGWTSTARGDVRPTRPLAVALYIRVSRNDSGQTSLIRAMVAQQHHAILVLEAFMAARGLGVGDVVITGMAYEIRSSYAHSLAARPVAAQLMGQLQRGAIQHIITCSLNRYVRASYVCTPVGRNWRRWWRCSYVNVCVGPVGMPRQVFPPKRRGRPGAPHLWSAQASGAGGE